MFINEYKPKYETLLLNGTTDITVERSASMAIIPTVENWQEG